MNLLKLIIVLLVGGAAMKAQAYQTKKVEFKSHGETLVGTLYLPDGKDKKHPGVVVTGAWTTVKEQMPKTYAIELANRGYAALTFDFRGWGESSGKFRFVEDPQRKTEDIIEAVNFLATQPEIESNKIAGLGICASSGYMAAAYTKNNKLKSVALIAPWLHNEEMATAVYGGKEAVSGLIKAADQAEAEFKKTGKLTTAVAASSTDKNSIMFQAPYYTQKDRGLIKEYDNKFNVASWKGWLTYNALESATKLPGKILLVGSEKIALPQGVKEYAKLGGKNVIQANLGTYNQFEFYDVKSAVSEASDKVASHFNSELK